MSTAREWYECLKHEAWAKLILVYGINDPTEREISLFILYGDKRFTRV